MPEPTEAPTSSATAPYRRWLERVYRDRPWIVAMDVLAAALPLADTLQSLGAPAPLCVGASPGTVMGSSAARSPEPIVLDVRASDMMDAIRASMGALADLPAWAVARIDAFDPERRARVIAAAFLDGGPLAGRARYGARPEEWQRLEDKTTVDALWDAAGVERAPSSVVALELGALRAASAAHDEGAGCVWVGDNRSGFHGAATYLRWVRTDAEARDALAFLSARCDRARVMPFLDGIPCSIHALVLPERTLAFRPCEMIVLRRPGESRLQYAQAGTFWDPPAADRAAMQALARRVGDHLRDTVGYRGFLTVDGVMTARGFLPTELNPRLGAAAGWLSAGLDLSLSLMNAAIIEGEPIDWDPADLERVIVTHADAHRGGRGMVIVSPRIAERQEERIVFDERGTARAAAVDEAADATLVLGPAPAGGMVLVSLAADRTPIGPSAAPRIAAALAWADARWELGIGPLDSAPDLRPGAAAGSCRT